MVVRMLHYKIKPGKLDEDEFTVMKTHVEHGMDITARASWLADAQDVVDAPAPPPPGQAGGRSWAVRACPAPVIGRRRSRPRSPSHRRGAPTVMTSLTPRFPVLMQNMITARVQPVPVTPVMTTVP